MTEPIRAILFDLEGTLYFKGALIEGATAALESVASSGHERRFLTNNDSKTRARMAQELAAFGLDLPVGEIFTASTAALAFLRQQTRARRRRRHLD